MKPHDFIIVLVCTGVLCGAKSIFPEPIRDTHTSSQLPMEDI